MIGYSFRLLKSSAVVNVCRKRVQYRQIRFDAPLRFEGFKLAFDLVVIVRQLNMRMGLAPLVQRRQRFWYIDYFRTQRP
jgi:hypothetical protein